MKRIYIIIILSVISFFTLTAGLMDDNGRAGASGAPGETTCNTSQCHNSYAVNTGGGSVTATCTMTNWKYEPLTTYYISIKVARTGNHLFGFGAEILTSTNTNAGTIAITDPAHTQIKSRTISGVSRKAAVHTLNGGASTDSMIFTFAWTSPDTTTGNITMYFCGNAANGNGQPTGDYVYTAQQIISPISSSTTSISDFSVADPVSVYPNPVSDNLNIHFNLKNSEEVTTKLFSLDGKKSFLLNKEEMQSGENILKASLPADCAPGIYILTLESPSAKMQKKIVVQ